MAGNTTASSPFLSDPTKYISLYSSGLTPLYTCVAALSWVLYDYLITLKEEVQHIWPQRNRSVAKIMFVWIRYYTIALLLFDVIQIHLFRKPGITNDTVCVAMDSIIRIVGAISLWSIELTMQLRLYAIYQCSKKAGCPLACQTSIGAQIVSFYSRLLSLTGSCSPLRSQVSCTCLSSMQKDDTQL
jgi:hypothetical protein